MPSQTDRLIFIVGPTAVGKTALSIELAKQLKSEIISADSRYLYKGMDIGTAKPSAKEMSGVKHHLINVTTIDQPWSLGVFKKQALMAVKEVQENKKMPILVGGTGQYIRAIIEGWSIPEIKPNNNLRNVVLKWGSQIGEKELHQKLYLLDPAAAKKIDYRNIRRVVRAYEVIFSTGKRFSEQRTKTKLPYSFKIIGLIRPRKELFSRIRMRLIQMVDQGFISEVRELLKDGFSQNNPPMSAIGYLEIEEYLKGKSGLMEALSRVEKRTKAFIRRQANWFKPDDPRIRWFSIDRHPVPEILEFINSTDNWIN